jgi:hypothetical protein
MGNSKEITIQMTSLLRPIRHLTCGGSAGLLPAFRRPGIPRRLPVKPALAGDI